MHINESEKACFSHDAAYSDNKDSVKRTISDKILKDKEFYNKLMQEQIYNNDILIYFTNNEGQ